MSQENVNSALAFADAFNRRDWNAFLALADEEIKVESRLVAMEGSYEGHEGLRRWWDNFLGAFPDYTVEVEELRDLGDVTLATSVVGDIAQVARRRLSIRSGNRSGGAKASASGGATVRQRTKPSKPPAFRSSRCRRRT